MEYENKKRKRRRERFLERMEVLIPWSMLLEEIQPSYPLEPVRVHWVQLFYI